MFDQAMFFDGPLELKGRVLGAVTIGVNGDIRLLDNIWYIDSDPSGRVNPQSSNVLGLISRGKILVANTRENGRANSSEGSDIIINGALLALDSFTFEDQNDVGDIYSGPLPDERGVIRLWGSVAQKRRGYVHRSNHGGTGYGKRYHIDERFDRMAPPCYPFATNEMNYSQFNIESWGAD
jgi:hypothetical protein